MDSFKQIYCRKYRCPDNGFSRMIFRRSLHWHAIPVWWALAVTGSGFFDFDLELINVVGRARTMQEVNEEIRDHTTDHRSRNWWRKVGRIRVSTQRVRKLARQCLSK